MNSKAIAKAEEIIKSKTAEVNMGVGVTLSLLDHEGYPTTSTLSISKTDGIRQITFAGSLDSNKVKRAKENSRASVCIFDDDYCPPQNNVTTRNAILGTEINTLTQVEKFMPRVLSSTFDDFLEVQ